MVAGFPADDLTLRVPKNDVSYVEGEIQRLQLRVDVDHYPRWARYHAAAVATIAVRRREYDAVLAQNFCPPFSGAPRVVLVHDALFVTNPEWFTKKELLYLRGSASLSSKGHNRPGYIPVRGGQDRSRVA